MEDLKKDITIYCHFSFKRPKDEPGVGLFAVAFYRDYEGKQVICHVTKKLALWKDHQFITAIQSYENALRVISEMQGAMKANNMNHVMLVTDNSTLAGWIENPRKNKDYTEYMTRAVSQYRSGSPREIVVGIGLCDVRDYEKSYKYCNEKYITPETSNKSNVNSEGKRVINIGGNSYKRISDIIKEEDNMPVVIGVTEIK